MTTAAELQIWRLILHQEGSRCAGMYDIGSRIEAMDEIKRALEIAEQIPFRFLIQHLGTSNEMFDDRKFEAAMTSVEHLRAFAKPLGVRILLENIPNELSAPDRLVGRERHHRDVGAVVGEQPRRIDRRRDPEVVTVGARAVVNAAGVWTDETQALAGERGQFHVRASKGIHLVVPRDRIRGDSGLILRTEKSVLFIIPWGRHWIIGTTDTDWALDLAHPAASATNASSTTENTTCTVTQSTESSWNSFHAAVYHVVVHPSGNQVPSQRLANELVATAAIISAMLMTKSVIRPSSRPRHTRSNHPCSAALTPYPR